ncbi:polyprenyl synthetase family protein [Calderihabitans maritimus]|uniref:Farnesyl diphosphate synthase n=1 Tax=Calderihabitans maritimus TaxID=1246530 RepID=A0A1Z5HXT9_9FIRM|nr:farnesyl diphosphate synthase [Calderihabitans maritimus]GAW94187.1 polyprenyl synthetase [Calderihabitans maritimus]
MDLQAYFAERIRLINDALDQYLPPENQPPVTIHQAMRYSVFAGGKRLRPILCMAAAEAVGGRTDRVVPAACALELIHTYSLIHDDLPAMDDDDYRRGKLTCHKVFGEAIAILAGDALLTYAFTLLAQQVKMVDISAEAALKVIEEISRAAGTGGMIGGQVMDLQAEEVQVDGDTLESIHKRKTGALISTSVRVGAMLAGAEEPELFFLAEYADNLGLAFQITDDILDLEGEEKKMGKRVGSDLKKKKATYPAFYGIERSKSIAREKVNRALQCLSNFGKEAEPLRMIARFLLNREY